MRIRYDHFMKLGWKFLIPVSLAWFVMVAVLQGYRAFFSGSPAGLLIVLAVVFLVAMLVLFFLPEADDDDPASGADSLTVPGEELDAFAGGYPVPPLPGQQLPLSPRVRRAQRAGDRARLDAASSVSSVTLAAAPDSGDIVQEGTDD